MNNNKLDIIKIKCSKCGKTINVFIKYRYTEDSSREDTYFKFGYFNEKTCNCETIQKEIEKVYNDASNTMIINH